MGGEGRGSGVEVAVEGTGDPDALRRAALAAADGFVPFLRDGGGRFGACWAAMMQAVVTQREAPGPRSANALRHAMERLWETPPDAFADAVSAGEWAMQARPAIRRALDACPPWPDAAPARGGRPRRKGGGAGALP